MPAVTGYLGRIHQVLQTGTSRIDVAAFRQKGYTKTGIGVGWFTASGVPVGWTHQMVSAPLLDLDRAVVRDGRLAADGPSYKVLFVEGDRFAGNEATLPVETARKLLSFARAGLPVVFLGSGWSAATVPGVGESGVLREVIAEVFAEPRVRVVADLTQVPGALAELGVSPDVSHPASTLLNHHRRSHGVDYFYLVNGKHSETVKPPVTAIDHDVTFTRSQRNAVPFRLDPWTGAVSHIEEYDEDGDRVTLRITLKPGEATIIAFRPGWQGEPSATLRGPSGAGALAAIPLDAWQLDVESYVPGPTPTETVIHRHRVSLDALVPWSAIPGLEDVSGVGRYTTVVDLDTATAHLDLGEVFDTAQVLVNGHRLPPVNLLNPVIDLSGHLRRGRNTIQVEVATTLFNRLRVVQPNAYTGNRQNYGLLGPARLISPA